MMENEFVFMKMAVDAARKCIAEDARTPPKVGAVVVKDGRMLATAFRGQIGPGEHAEYTALERMLKSETLSGCTVYTTLEPCTDRNPPKLSCCDRLKDRKVGRVVIGMLDPNQSIRGKGILLLRKAGIEVAFFPHELMTELEELNRDFIRDQQEERNSIISIDINGDDLNHIQNELTNVKSEYATLLIKYTSLIQEKQTIKTIINEDKIIEDAIIALCSPFYDLQLNDIFRIFLADNNEATIRITSAIGRLKSRGIIYNKSIIFPQSFRLRQQTTNSCI